MGGSVGRVDKKVVHVDDKLSSYNHIVKGVIHKPLKGGGGIGETTEHYGRFEESFMSDESGLPLVSIFDMDIAIPPADVELGEDLCSLEFIDKIGDEWKEVGVMDSVFIEIAIV